MTRTVRECEDVGRNRVRVVDGSKAAAARCLNTLLGVEDKVHEETCWDQMKDHRASTKSRTRKCHSLTGVDDRTDSIANRDCGHYCRWPSSFSLSLHVVDVC